MTEREHAIEDEDARDVADNPEWSELDIRAGRTLTDFEPALALNIARVLGRPTRSPPRDTDPGTETEKTGG